MRPVWSGAISFGLVTIPCKVLSATESHNISFHQVHEADGGRIRYQKVCTLDDKVLSQDEIGRGYEISKDTVIPVTDADLDGMPLPTAKAIEIVAFVPASSIDPIRIGDSYYLQADGQVAAKPYKLLREALNRSDRVAIAKFAWHNRERLGLLQVLDGEVIALHSMRWPDEIRDPAAVAPPAMDIDDSEVDGAIALIDAMTTDDLTQFHDDYRTALEELLQAKAEHREPQPVGQAPEPAGKVVDLMAALNASVEKAKASRGESGEDATVHEMPKPKKTAAKKTAAKKTTAKKAPARKPRKAG
ncbi:non-homologous end joining protein Ku [Streptomyces lavendofoliae]|uniref:Non-homologous end joining protein Ku n=1 Tax=Streptomyces lavendofoliae TaxID=67314 RepID=A0A918I369_9ACTN|nr:Ku protein [Streptomyces lavendofoliae]GGU62289.1 non-homologous end joining protein Ku [Streptomyces lavendofoliae]